MIAAVGNGGVVQALLQASYYDASKGGFVSEDPVFLGDPKQQTLTDPQGLNSYSYENDNPITKSDPNGRLALGLNYGVNAEAGFGAFSAFNSGGGTNIVFGPATRQFSVVNTASGAVNSGYLIAIGARPTTDELPLY
jgi:RHS repeat-associated protein